MAGTIVITCPDCEKQTKVPDNLAGKKVRCKGCGSVVAVPQKRTIDTRMATPEVKKKLRPSEEEDASKPYGVEEISVAPRCPHCAYEMEPPDAVICLHCGYNMTKRRRVDTHPSKRLRDLVVTEWRNVNDLRRVHTPTLCERLQTRVVIDVVTPAGKNHLDAESRSLTEYLLNHAEHLRRTTRGKTDRVHLVDPPRPQRGRARASQRRRRARHGSSPQ